MHFNHKAVARHMREMGLQAVYPGPNLSKRAHQAGIYPYLLKNIAASAPNHIWGIDRSDTVIFTYSMTGKVEGGYAFPGVAQVSVTSPDPVQSNQVMPADTCRPAGTTDAAPIHIE